MQQKTAIVQVRLTPMEKANWVRSAGLLKVSLSNFIKSSVAKMRAEIQRERIVQRLARPTPRAAKPARGDSGRRPAKQG